MTNTMIFSHARIRFLAFATTGIALLLCACETGEGVPPAETTKSKSRTNPTDELEIGAVAEEVAVTSTTPRYAKGIVATSPSIINVEPENRERYDNGDPNPVKRVSDEPVSTFSSDVDTSAYTVMRRYLQKFNQLPPAPSVRVEEYINYFDYDYAAPTSAEEPFSPTVWISPTPWNANTHLMQIGVKGFDLPDTATPDANIVFLIDVSGSMRGDDKLPLVKKSIEMMVDEMGPDDLMSIVVYSGAAGVVLEPTPGSQKTKILSALSDLQSGGSTAGGAGLSLAYKLAEENFDKDRVNRIILASDGDFNVGITDYEILEGFVAEKRKTGIFLTILGFGGQNYNDVLAQKLAQAGNGVAVYIDILNEARKVLVTEIRSTLFPIATDLKFQIEFNPVVVSEYRLIGYETRILNEEDFNNDAVDAGDIGSAHTVTAMYELALKGSKGQLIDQRRYPENRPSTHNQKLSGSEELGFLKLRYKLPGNSTSDLISMPVMKHTIIRSSTRTPREARFAGAVAAYGQKIAGSPYASRMSWQSIIDLAQGAKGDDPYGLRSEFVQLIRAAEKTSSTASDHLN